MPARGLAAFRRFALSVVRVYPPVLVLRVALGLDLNATLTPCLRRA